MHLSLLEQKRSHVPRPETNLKPLGDFLVWGETKKIWHNIYILIISTLMLETIHFLHQLVCRASTLINEKLSFKYPNVRSWGVQLQISHCVNDSPHDLSQ